MKKRLPESGGLFYKLNVLTPLAPLSALQRGGVNMLYSN
jgi:hypothetical protein